MANAEGALVSGPCILNDAWAGQMWTRDDPFNFGWMDILIRSSDGTIRFITVDEFDPTDSCPAIIINHLSDETPPDMDDFVEIGDPALRSHIVESVNAADRGWPPII